MRTAAVRTNEETERECRLQSIHAWLQARRLRPGREQSAAYAAAGGGEWLCGLAAVARRNNGELGRPARRHRAVQRSHYLLSKWRASFTRRAAADGAS